MVSRYVTNGPVKEGICIMPPTHYRMMPPQRTDGFHVPTPYVPQQQPNQPGNQSQTLRGIQPTGPPTQASTPPTNDLKVQSVPPQQSMNHLYVNPQQQVRGTQAPYYRTAAGPPSQAPRMPSQHRGQMYQPQATQYMPLPMPPMYLTTNTMYNYSGQRPQTFVQQTLPVYGTQIPSQFQFQPNHNQTAAVSYPFYPIPRQGHPPQPAAVPTNATQPLQNMPIAQNTVPQQSFQRQNKRRPKAIAIIDPDTGADRLDEVYEQSNSHPPSGESSARQTPQPAIPNPNKEVQAAFAKQVAQAISNDEPSIEDQDLHNPSIEPLEATYHPGVQVQPPTSIDHLVLSSTLKAQAKEFVLNSSNTAKEPPIVSAITDAVEVTLPNKQVKDRESPAKGRKQREQQQMRDHNKDNVKDTPIREIVSDKESSNIKNDNKLKESIVPPTNIATTVTVMPIISKDNKEVVNINTTTHRDDNNKKSHKKDSNKTDSKVPNIENNESANISSNQLAQPAQDVSSSAKSKNASQRTKEVQKQQQQVSQTTGNQKQQQQQQQQQSVAPVPQPQPAKPSSKSSKKTELNQKGANKEGTDMDAFNDSMGRLDTVNANTEMSLDNVTTNNATPIPANININNESANKKNHNSTTTITGATPVVETITTKPEPKMLPKSKIDITDIVRDKPKPIKSFPVATTAANVESSHDEPDRAPLVANDKLVQAKNEANIKANAENIAPALIESKLDNVHKEEQVAAQNMVDGKLVYQREFLLALRNNPASKKRPENVPDFVMADDRGRLSEGRYSMGRSTDFTTPPFGSYGGKSGSQRGPPPKRGSQSKAGGSGGGGGKGSKQQVIKVSISVREDVKLHESENAWKPARFKKGADATAEDYKTEELYRRVRGVLNKLTPQKFATLIGQVRDLQIDTADRLQGVIDLVFEKAVDEPNFSVAYALMCRELAMMQVPAANSTEEKKEFVNFRKLLVTRCQFEFEKQSQDETERRKKVEVIEKCTNPEKKKELQLELSEYDRRLRMKSVGNIRFIGELFKQQMLTVNIMVRCLNNLLESKDEENMECLCKLLTTIGKELETKKIDLTSIFNIMKDIVDKKYGRVSSRVRFMLQDVIDLRKNKWIPRRQDSNPKTIDQIQKEAENEQLHIQAMNSVPITPRKDDRGGSAGPNSDRKRRTITDDGWQTASRNRQTQFTIYSDKLKNKPPLTDEPLGSSKMFGNWSRGSNIKADVSAATNTANMYAALEHIDTEKRPPGSRSSSKDPYSSKGTSLERSTYKQQPYDGRGSSRSGSQHRSNDRESSVPLSNQKAPPAPASVPDNKPIQASATSYIMNEEQLDRHLKNNLDEYLNDSCTVEEYGQDTQTSVPPPYLPRMVAEGYIHVLERSLTARVRTGMLFASLIKLGVLSIDDYCTGLEEVLSQADDLTIDIPMIWDYLAEILVHLICEEALPLSRLHKSCQLLISQGHGSKLLAPLFKLVISEKGPNFLSNYWQLSGLTFADFMNPAQVDSFVKDNKLEFLCGGDPVSGQSQLTYEQIYRKLTEFFSLKTSFDDIVNWITANVGERVTENRFIRALATAIFETSISRHKLVNENLQSHYKLLQKYVDNNAHYELQCLYALQALINKMEHPQGLLLSICDRLYEDLIISQDSFITWEVNEDPAEQEGKGVTLKQLTSFFTQLRENEEDEYGSSSEEA